MRGGADPVPVCFLPAPLNFCHHPSFVLKVDRLGSSAAGLLSTSQAPPTLSA